LKASLVSREAFLLRASGGQGSNSVAGWAARAGDADIDAAKDVFVKLP
jgi:hypothetical protein